MFLQTAPSISKQADIRSRQIPTAARLERENCCLKMQLCRHLRCRLRIRIDPRVTAARLQACTASRHQRLLPTCASASASEPHEKWPTQPSGQSDVTGALHNSKSILRCFLGEPACMAHRSTHQQHIVRMQILRRSIRGEAVSSPKISATTDSKLMTVLTASAPRVLAEIPWPAILRFACAHPAVAPTATARLCGWTLPLPRARARGIAPDPLDR